MKQLQVVSADRIGLIKEISKLIGRLDGSIADHTANVVMDERGRHFSYFSAKVDFKKDPDDELIVKRISGIKNVRKVSITDI